MRKVGSRIPLRAALTCSAVLTLHLFGAPPVAGTNGYFTHGYGTLAKGMAGAGVALPQDALAAATNPAGLAFVGQRYDAGLALFHPSRAYRVEGAPSEFPGTFGLMPGTVGSGSELFAIPSFGANWQLSESSAFGLCILGNGGMNTDYPTATFFGSGSTGVDFSQLFLAPTYATRLSSRHALGVSAVLAYQRFEAQGLQAFAAFSANPESLTNNGHDDSTGVGARIGYLGHLTQALSVGASYQSRIDVGQFESYAGLFSPAGDLDVPATAIVGVAYRFRPSLVLAIDVQQVYYSGIQAVGTPAFPQLSVAQLGASNGPGFGWEDMTIFKAGVQWDTGETWSWRVGVSTTEQPVPASEVLFNILAPAVVEEHFAFGFSKKLRGGQDLNVSLTHAPAKSVRGPNPMEVAGSQSIELEMSQWELELSYSWGL